LREEQGIKSLFEERRVKGEVFCRDPREIREDGADGVSESGDPRFRLGWSHGDGRRSEIG
jgi:hypothetical protein